MVSSQSCTKVDVVFSEGGGDGGGGKGADGCRRGHHEKRNMKGTDENDACSSGDAMGCLKWSSCMFDAIVSVPFVPLAAVAV